MQQEKQIFTPENIRGFIGRKVIVTDVTGLECHQIMEASVSGAAVRLSLLHPAAARTSWWELAKLTQKFYDFAPDEKEAANNKYKDRHYVAGEKLDKGDPVFVGADSKIYKTQDPAKEYPDPEKDY